MKPGEQRIAIAKVCGWKVEQLASGWLWTHPNYSPQLNTGCPDYPADLNAMHEAEKLLKPEQHFTFQVELARVVDTVIYPLNFALLRATAAQRAEAFLRTLNLWTSS